MSMCGTASDRAGESERDEAVEAPVRHGCTWVYVCTASNFACFENEASSHM